MNACQLQQADKVQCGPEVISAKDVSAGGLM